jgi:CheY-like chemotaxis protein
MTENLSKYTALIVDDDPYNRDIARSILEHTGYIVTEAADGESGLTILQAETFDLLMIDLQMPRVKGREVIERVRQDPRHAQMQIIISTANPHMIDEVLQEQADYILNKPYDVRQFGQLCERIKSTLHTG